MNIKVCLVGPLPDPVGGISSYCNRCINGDLSNYYSEVIDFYPHMSKVEVPNSVSHKVAPVKYFVLKLIWFWYKISFTNCNVVHFNFSSTASLLFSLFCWKKNRKWVVMLHSGNLQSGGFLRNVLMKISLKKYNTIIAISSKQKNFYESMRYNFNIVDVDSYLPPPSNLKTEICKNIEIVFETFSSVVLGSGYSLEIYRFDFIIDYARKHPDIGIIIITYGNSDESVTRMLKIAQQELKNVYIFSTINEGMFLHLLSRVSLYVRPNDVDSFGIACADSILLNTPVVASDTCTRYQGCKIFETGNYQDFEDAVDEGLRSTVKLSSKLVLAESRNKIQLYKKVYELL